MEFNILLWAYIELFNGAQRQAYQLLVCRDFEIGDRYKQSAHELNHESHYRSIRFNVFHSIERPV